MTRTLSGRERDRTFVRVHGTETYLDVAFVLGTDSVTDSRALAEADLDGDGDLDLILRAEKPQKLRVFRNEGPVGPSIELRFATTRDAAGAMILVDSPGRSRVIPLLLGQGYLAQDPPRKRIPFPSDAPPRIRVRWPGIEAIEIPKPEAGALIVLRRFPEPGIATLIPPPPARLGKDAAPPPRTCDLLALGQDLPEDDTHLRPHLEATAWTRPLLLNFWAPWCKPCRKELPLVAAFAKAHPEVDVRLVAVDGTKKAIRKMIARLAPGLSVVRTRAGSVDRRGDTLRIPSTCFFARDRSLGRAFNTPVSVETLEALLPLRPAPRPSEE